MNTTPMKSDSNPAAASQARPEPHKTEEKKPKTGSFRSPRLHSWLMMGAGLCTTLSYIAKIAPGPKLPVSQGE